MNYILINKEFADRFKKSLGQTITKAELEQVYGEHTEPRIKAFLNSYIAYPKEILKKGELPEPVSKNDKVSK